MFLKNTFACGLIFAAAIHAQSQVSTLSQLPSNHTLSHRAASGATVDAADFHHRGFAFISNDSVFLRSGQVVALACVGCQPFLQDGPLDSLPLPLEYHSLPLQKLIRVFTSQTHPGSPIYFLMARPSGVCWWKFEGTGVYGSHGVETMNLISRDSASLSLGPGQIVYGIDEFTATPEQMNFRIFGKAGLRAKVTISNSGDPSVQFFNFPDSLDFTASAPGLFATSKGQILDSTLNWVPQKMGSRPFSLVNSTGAVGDSGLFALKVAGVWRTFLQTGGNLRDFSTQIKGPTFEGWWGTRGIFWDDRFSKTSQFIKDDSTVWVTSFNQPPAIPREDSISIFSSVPDSVSLQLFDADNNYARPTISLHRHNGQVIAMQGLWGKFSKGCVGELLDTITCYASISQSRLSLAWGASAIRIRTELHKGAWRFGYVTELYYYFEGSPFQRDTVIPWSIGDTLRVQFSNAAYNLVHASTTMIPGIQEPAPAAWARTMGREIQWSASIAAELGWEIRGFNGRVISVGSIPSQKGRMRIPVNSTGIHFLTLMNLNTRRVLWRSRVFLP
jgi:hypothetical protein